MANWVDTGEIPTFFFKSEVTAPNASLCSDFAQQPFNIILTQRWESRFSEGNNMMLSSESRKGGYWDFSYTFYTLDIWVRRQIVGVFSQVEFEDVS